MTTIDQYIHQNRKFDYIFGDLTDVPFSEERTGSNWNFITAILQKSLKIMKPTGKFLTQVRKSFLTVFDFLFIFYFSVTQ